MMRGISALTNLARSSGVPLSAIMCLPVSACVCLCPVSTLRVPARCLANTTAVCWFMLMAAVCVAVASVVRLSTVHWSMRGHVSPST